MRNVIAVLLLTLCSFALAATAPAPPASAAQPDTPATVIRSPAQLQQYLRTHKDTATPLDALSPGARERFLASLRFGAHGLGGFATEDLSSELDATQIRRVLALFGAADYADSIPPANEPLRGSDPPTAVDRQYTAFFIDTLPQHDHTAEERAVRTRATYRKRIAPLQSRQTLARASPHDLSLLYRAAMDLAAADKDNPHVLADAHRDLQGLAAHGLATPARVQELYRLLVGARKFGQAHELAHKYPTAKLEPLPRLRDETGGDTGKPTYLLLKPDEHELVRKSIDLDHGLHIIVISGCHFSVDAVKGVESVPRIAELFQRHAIWLASQTESLADVAVWNREHPQQPMRVAWKNSEWTRITSWAMPTFYIFRDGKLVDQWAGWPADTGLSTLRRHLARNGLWTAP